MRKRATPPNLTLRASCIAAAIGLAQLLPQAMLQAAAPPPKESEPPGNWPGPRQNRCLTSIQPLAGRMITAPEIVAEISFPKGQGAVTGFASKPGGPVDRAVVIANGSLCCYRLDGSLAWEAHPPGLNFESVVVAEDLNGDGRVDLALTAGRPTSPLGAAALLSADTGETLFRYDVEPMSYWWTMKVNRYLPEGVGKQIVVCEQGYPPDAKFGYIAMFAFDKPGEQPRQRWRYDFDHYTCIPTLLTADVNGDGVNELCVETHSKMWVLDPRTGKVAQFLTWDVSPANVRSYGLVRFQDLNGDGLPEFFCIANFAQHHEVLLNENGRLNLAWTHGWDTSVTTQTIETTWPDPPIADVDGDGKLEMVVNLFASDGQPRWIVRIYDALTGEIKAIVRDRVATYLSDVDADGTPELLADISKDPTLTDIQGACLLKVAGKEYKELWKQEGVRSAPVLPVRRNEGAEKLADVIFVQTKSNTQRLNWSADKGVELAEGQPPAQPRRSKKAGRNSELNETSPPAPPAGPDFSRIPATVGPALNPPLVADVDGDGKNEVIHYHQGRVGIYRYAGLARQGRNTRSADSLVRQSDAGAVSRADKAVRAPAESPHATAAVGDGATNGFVKIAEYSSTAPPALADLDGDGQLELVIGDASPTTDPVIHALRPGRRPETLWKVTLTPRERKGLPHGPPLAFQTGHFLGRPGYDLYVYVGTPHMRSLVLDGSNGDLIWEKSKIPDLERYYGPTMNLSAVWDINGDGKDDLVFTCPDYYCVASGPTGEPLVGPAFPPNIFKQPSQGLYTLPAILPERQGEPTVCLVDGHYFVAAMTSHAAAKWFHLPVVGEARAGAEGFLKATDGKWLMGYGRQDGQFACLDVATGKVRWEFPLESTASAVAACDINGDGTQEFIFGTTHGELYALADAGNSARVVWKARLPASVGAPVTAEVDNDGASEILVSLGDGRLSLLRSNK